MVEIDKEEPLINDDALLGKIETLYREADDFSAALKPSSSVRSQDVKRLPIIGSLPVITADKQSKGPYQKDSPRSLSPTAEIGIMKNVVLTGIVSRPGSEFESDDTNLLADKHLEKSFPSSSSEDPFIAIKNAVEIASQSDNKNANSLGNQPSKEKSASQTSELAHAIAEIIKQQIDSAIESHIAATQELRGTKTSGTSNNTVAVQEKLTPKREAKKSASKKRAKIAQNTKNRTTTSKLSIKATRAKDD